jgi:hypothetical protein
MKQFLQSLHNINYFRVYFHVDDDYILLETFFDVISNNNQDVHFSIYLEKEGGRWPVGEFLDSKNLLYIVEKPCEMSITTVRAFFKLEMQIAATQRSRSLKMIADSANLVKKSSSLSEQLKIWMRFGRTLKLFYATIARNDTL